ncbi:MAG: hypothetical protein EA369_05535 [Bradymonadales bacterium]|nr:MAG: hypothetical protein EA369_05535 [Bradymonadales bacterium]
MKSFVTLTMTCTVFLLGLGFTSSYAQKLEESLEVWLEQEPVQDGVHELRQNKKRVIVYFQAAPFQDRSGPSVTEAIEAEEQFNRSRLIRNWVQVVRESPAVDLIWSANAVVSEVTRSDLRRLNRDDQVVKVIEDRVFTMERPRPEANRTRTDESKLTYGLQVMNVPSVWDQGYTGRGVLVGVLDTGIDLEHPNLKGRVVAHRDFTNENDIKDGNGHGTHVAGTIAGNDHGGTAIGVAPDSELIIAKIFDSRGRTQLSSILNAMQWMLSARDPARPDQPVHVASNSWGAAIPFILGFADSVRSWRRFGIFPNFAAGNSGSRPLSVGAPASYSFSFAVGAVDENMNITSFSSRGPSVWLPRWDMEDPRWFQGWWPQLLKKPEVSAPGLNVLSAIPNGELRRYSGTSMATPHVAGVLALILEANPHLTIEELEEILNETAQSRGAEGKNNTYGHGVVQADVAVERALEVLGGKSPGFEDRNPNNWHWHEP